MRDDVACRRVLLAAAAGSYVALTHSVGTFSFFSHSATRQTELTRLKLAIDTG